MTASKKKKVKKILLIFLVIVAVFLMFTFVRHRIMLKQEEELVKPVGQMVDVDGLHLLLTASQKRCGQPDSRP